VVSLTSSVLFIASRKVATDSSFSLAMLPMSLLLPGWLVEVFDIRAEILQCAEEGDILVRAAFSLDFGMVDTCDKLKKNFAETLALRRAIYQWLGHTPFLRLLRFLNKPSTSCYLFSEVFCLHLTIPSLVWEFLY